MNIRKITREDEENFYWMAEQFYSSEAVLHSIPKKHHIDAFKEMMRSNIYLEGFIFEVDGNCAGYALTSKMYSQEAGGITLWLDELFVLEQYRSKGIGKEFFNYLKESLDSSIVRLRLEVEENNNRAIKLYNKTGFNRLEYSQMILDVDK